MCHIMHIFLNIKFFTLVDFCNAISYEHVKLLSILKLHNVKFFQFFTRFYQYHQGGGFVCVTTARVCSLLQYLFIVLFSTFLVECVDYPVLFNNKNTTADGIPITGKRHIQLMTLIFVLGIDDDNLGNLTWCEVLALLCQKLPDLHVIITKDKLNELDICQRILRFKNYFVALVNKDMLPPVVNIPFLGPQPYLSSGLKLNLDFLFFWGSFSPWEGPYTLKDEYKDPQNIGKLSNSFVCINTQCHKFFIYTINSCIPSVIHFFLLCGAYKKRSNTKLRHFNELDHQLQIRLSRSYDFATRYMNLFTSPLIEIIAKSLKFVTGSIFAVLFALAAWDEDVLTVNLEHALTLMTATFLIVIVCSSMITSDDCVYMPERLMRSIIACIHYAPISWEGKAHTRAVRKEFDSLYPLTFRYILEELFSPLITPFILFFWVRPRMQKFVEFFIRFTVSIEGLGDVCSFAQMDIAKHGDEKCIFILAIDGVAFDKDEDYIANDGKTEISLLNFAAMNPLWEPPPLAAEFINDLKTHVSCLSVFLILFEHILKNVW
uniref:Autophagy-related protein 9 n=1 Tax=Syphacia muris TaxID=451379 RepID=A0A0N5AAR9_9BILA